ncbi:DNA oxidative demethylase ALKBH2-like [Ruditapes philippinarum]|uniref:DNA oxidative demethylase ALKBH2-like n=1 Tax=Ruditapes philippinarum TaxID=129788 RepID=UPI00295B4A32|nr:DNA oxidative demethylase ALKBH2-like [Ruditapes philippinarum]
MDELETKKRRVETEELNKEKKCKTERSSDKQKISDKGENSKTDVDCAISKNGAKSLSWRELRAENLVCDYCMLFNKSQADDIFEECEKLLTYNDGKLAQIKLYGKWINIPRKQVLKGSIYQIKYYTSVPARPWTPFLENIRDIISDATGFDFNFVLINRYKDGHDYIGEHRDDEKDLVSGHPIASLSLGQPRDFIFKHASARGKNATCKIDPVKLELEHGSLLVMKHPTNIYWYHSLPQRKKLTQVRINMTFRKMVVK